MVNPVRSPLKSALNHLASNGVKIGLIGCGAIGKEIANGIEDDLRGKARLVAVSDVDRKKAETLSRSLKSKPVVSSANELMRRSDFVVEAASVKVSAAVAEEALKLKKDVLVLSVGGLLGKKRIFELANKNRCHLYIPSGAICGIDGVKGARLGGIRSASLKTTKPPKAFEGAPLVVKKGIRLKGLKKETLLFKGRADEAVVNFPQNINVASTLSLAGIGAGKTLVEIAASPKQKMNTHEIKLNGDFGVLTVRVENAPSKENIKTSRLAGLSARAMLKDIFSYVHIGT